METPSTPTTPPPPTRPPVRRTYGKKPSQPFIPIFSSPPSLPSLIRSDSGLSIETLETLGSSELGAGLGLAVGSDLEVREEPTGKKEKRGLGEEEGALRWIKRADGEGRVGLGMDFGGGRGRVSSLGPGSKGRAGTGMGMGQMGQMGLKSFFAPRPRGTIGSGSSGGSGLRGEGPGLSSGRGSEGSSSTRIEIERVGSPVTLGGTMKRTMTAATTTTSSIISTTSLTTPTPTRPKKLRQLHFKPLFSSPSSSSSSSSLFTTCRKCNTSYTRGSPDSPDELMHRKNCERVMYGEIWAGDTGRDLGEEVFGRKEDGEVVMGMGMGKGKGGGKGRVVRVDGDVAIKNDQIMDILGSIDTVLSSPSLPSSTLKSSHIYLFLTTSPPPPSKGKRLAPSSITSSSKGKTKGKVRVVACVVVQRIRWGMRIVPNNLPVDTGGVDGNPIETGAGGGKRKREDLVIVETPSTGVDEDDGGVLCYPERIPTRLGVHRIFTVPSYRGCGIIKILLDSACAHSIYGYKCDPLKGDVAFSQPTQSGRRVMNTWGGGGVLVFNEDEQEEDTSGLSRGVSFGDDSASV